MLQTEYVSPIAFSWQQWYHKPATVFHYTYIACLIHKNNQ